MYKKLEEEEAIAKILGKNLRRIRKKYGNSDITQIEAAKIIGISRSAYLNIERGIVVPRVAVLLKISKSFNVTIEELLEGVEVWKRSQMWPFLIFIFFIYMI